MMKQKIHIEDLSRNTKAYVLLALILVSLEYMFRPMEEGYALIALLAVLGVLLVENFVLFIDHFPRAWNFIKWFILLILTLLILIGSINA